MSKIKKYRVIGDIHGRTNWRKLVEPFDNTIKYIFLGDFTDPYYGWEKVTYSGMLGELNGVLQFKREHPDNVVILGANHDCQYWLMKADTNRYDYQHYSEIHKIFVDNEPLFDDIAYSIKEKYLISHAGVTFDWYSARVKKGKDHTIIGKEKLKTMCDQINEVWRTNKELFTFATNATKMSDYYGESPLHSPIWIRPASLWSNNVFGWTSGIIQIVGHTPFESFMYPENNGKIATFCTNKQPATPEEIDRGNHYLMDDNNNICSLVENGEDNIEIILCDCLATETACVEIDADTLEWKKIVVKNAN